MIKLTRRIHSIAGLLLLVWVLIYFVTGYVMVREKWFPRTAPVTETKTEALTWEGDPNPEALRVYLEMTYGFRGKAKPPAKSEDGSWNFVWSAPGGDQEARVSSDGKQVQITRRNNGLVALMHALHRLHGYEGGLKYDLWAFFFDLTSAAMILFAVTGVSLWWKTTRARLAGWICLLGSFAFTAGVFYRLMIMR